MLCTRFWKRSCIATPVNFILKAKYSRRSYKDTDSYKVVKSNEDSLDDLENAVLGTNPNWELLAPRGFRFYLPGSIGPGWLDASTTAQIEARSMILHNDDDVLTDVLARNVQNSIIDSKFELDQPVLHCVAQECPVLLRKSLAELFPGCLEVKSPQLTIVTISQKTNCRTMRWSKEVETEKLAKFFVLAASDICRKLKLVGYWADFINPFSGQPYLNPHKNGILYETDERFRCLGFKIQQKNFCKVIAYDGSTKNFVGNLYTTAPSSTKFLKDLMTDLSGQ